jgi:hypothetical protein
MLNEEFVLHYVYFNFKLFYLCILVLNRMIFLVWLMRQAKDFKFKVYYSYSRMRKSKVQIIDFKFKETYTKETCDSAPKYNEH